MPSLIAGPPKLPATPSLAPPKNSALTAQLQALGRRAGSSAAVMTGPGGATTRGSLMTHTLTGS